MLPGVPAAEEAGAIAATAPPPHPRHRVTVRFGAVPAGMVLAAVAAISSFTVTLIRLPVLLAAVYRYSDVPSVAYIAQGLATGHGPQLLPTQTSIGIIWLDELLQWLPGRMAVEYWTGPVLAVVMALLVVRASHLALGVRAAVWSGLTLLVLPPVILWPLLFPDAHVTTFVAAALLGWHLALDLRGRSSMARAVAIGIVVGVCIVSDPQLLAFGVVPYALVLGVLRRHVAARFVQSVLFTMGAAVIAAGLTYAAMYMQHFSTVTLLPGSSGLAAVAPGMGLALQMLFWTAGGQWYGQPASVISTALCALGAAAIAMNAFVSHSTARRPPELGADAIVRRGHLIYWWTSMACLLAAFLLLGFGAGGAPIQGHYLVGCYIAAAAVLPAGRRLHAAALDSVAQRRRSRAAALLTAAGFSVFAVTIAVRTATFDASLFELQLQVPASQDPLPVLLEHHLSRGYAGYWEAYDLDWRSGGAVSVWPVLSGAGACSGGAEKLCPYAFAPQGEYTTMAGSSFVITPATGTSCEAAPPSAAVFGSATAVYRRGPYTISVYPYDVASRFTHRERLFC